MEWAREFVQHINQQNDGKSHLLLLDGHGTCMYNLAFLILMRENNIYVMCFPSHTTHVLQPTGKFVQITQVNLDY